VSFKLNGPRHRPKCPIFQTLRDRSLIIGGGGGLVQNGGGSLIFMQGKKGGHVNSCKKKHAVANFFN
jgi:hypothetical protein